MIGPKSPKPTAAEERRAYTLATVRDRGVCQRCFRDCGAVQRDHRKNRSQGGLTVASNLQLLGVGCHLWKGAHPEQAAAEGWAVPGTFDPLTYPARRWQETGLGKGALVWVLYRDDGSWDQITDEEAVRRINEGRMYEGAA